MTEPDVKTVVFSHAVHESAMRRIGEKVNVVVLNSSDTDSCIEALTQAEGFVMRIGRIGRDIMDRCPKLAVIARFGVGVDTVDVQAATGRGIPVTIASGANVRSVAEHTVALMYAIAKNLVEYHVENRKGDYFIRDKQASVELCGRRAGIVGFGVIGRETARIMKNNDLEVSVYDPFVKKETVEEMGYTFEGNLQDLLGSVDVLSLHLPLMEETRGFLGKAEFDAMKEGMLLVNCARGGIIAEDALYDAMKDGKVAAAGVDVMCEEPTNPHSKLFELPNFIATPHIAALSREAFIKVSDMVVDGVLSILSGQRWPHVFNPDAYRHPRWNRHAG
ncbi:MAG: hydroxyacid dehydrogenase [Synergistaceae bacterium]|jgi:D-3-phosphoglycerate dehydrogenase|nr:hydroxyacid dehydrogenase [Synergistaceae bacterium]